MHDALHSKVPAAADGRTIVAWLAERFRYCTEGEWAAHVAAGRVHVDGAVVTPTSTVRAGHTVAFFPPPAAGTAADVPILFADDDLLVVDKPPHRVVQTVGAFAHATFLPALAARFPPAPGTARLEPVHRLDRETSGVLLIARSLAATRALQRQFEAGLVDKHYLAVVHGTLATDTLTIDAPIGLAPHSAIAARRAVVAAGTRGARAARTEVVVERRFAAHTLLRVTPRTGRTHQIRVHLEHVGHPLVGDKLYGQDDASYLAWVAHLKADGDPRTRDGAPVVRQLLHAAALRCQHPRTGDPLDLKAPLPADFDSFRN